MSEARLSIIAALDRNNLIGNLNRMPWNIPEDLRWFRSKTLDHTVIMGKNTWLSLGRTLDRRTNIVLTRDPDFFVPGVIVCHSLEECLSHCGTEECFIIGGAEIFRLFLPLASKLYITLIDAVFEGDRYFPAFEPQDWETLYFEVVESRNGYQLTFTEYQRKEH